MLNFEHYLPTKIFFGKGQIENLGKEAAKYGDKVLLVYGGGSIMKNGVYAAAKAQLEGFKVFELGGVEPNPRVDTCQKGADICKKEGIDLVLAVGGGSVADSAKAIAAGAKYDGEVWDLVTKKAPVEDALPVGVVITLAATGSEYNHIGVISNMKTNQKLPLISPHVYPKFSIMDPEYTFSVPRNHTAYGVADAMVHVFDQYFTKVEDTPMQDRFGEGVVKTIIENGPIVLENPNDYAARANIMWCSAWAMSQTAARGKQGDTTTHGLEHEVSAYYDIPHGLGIAIIWPNWARFVYKDALPKFKQFAIRVMDVDPAGKSDEDIALEGINRVADYYKSLGLESKLSELGIDDKYFDAMVANFLKFRGNGGFEKTLGEAELKQILINSL